MTMGRQYHACAMRGKDVFVFGGEASTRNSFEAWDGHIWSYSIGLIGSTDLQFIPQGRNLYLFGGWETNEDLLSYHDLGIDLDKLANTIWKINHHNQFIEAGNILIRRKMYALFTVPHGFLTNCQGKQI